VIEQIVRESVVQGSVELVESQFRLGELDELIEIESSIDFGVQPAIAADVEDAHAEALQLCLFLRSPLAQTRGNHLQCLHLVALPLKLQQILEKQGGLGDLQLERLYRQWIDGY